MIREELALRVYVPLRPWCRCIVCHASVCRHLNDGGMKFPNVIVFTHYYPMYYRDLGIPRQVSREQVPLSL